MWLQAPGGERRRDRVPARRPSASPLKVESHNHPSAVEPFQGAATGVGGILARHPSRWAPPRPRSRSLDSACAFGEPAQPTPAQPVRGGGRGRPATYGELRSASATGRRVYCRAGLRAQLWSPGHAMFLASGFCRRQRPHVPPAPPTSATCGACTARRPAATANRRRQRAGLAGFDRAPPTTAQSSHIGDPVHGQEADRVHARSLPRRGSCRPSLAGPGRGRAWPPFHWS